MTARRKSGGLVPCDNRVVARIVQLQNTFIHGELIVKLGSRLSTLATEMELFKGLKNKAKAARQAVKSRMAEIQSVIPPNPALSGNTASIARLRSPFDATQDQGLELQLPQQQQQQQLAASGTSQPVVVASDNVSTRRAASVASPARTTSSVELIAQRLFTEQKTQQAGEHMFRLVSLRL